MTSRIFANNTLHHVEGGLAGHYASAIVIETKANPRPQFL